MDIGTELIEAERIRQIDEEGYTESHDNIHSWKDLAFAGIAYSFTATNLPLHASENWPWNDESFKPLDPLRDLVRAGALIAAAIDRLQREAVRPAGTTSSESGTHLVSEKDVGGKHDGKRATKD